MLKPCYARLTLVLMLALYVLRGPRDCGLSGDWVDADPPPTGVRTAVDPPVFAPFDGQICRQFTAKHRLDRRPATTPMLAYSPESFASSGPPFTLRINPMSLDYHATREAVAEYLADKDETSMAAVAWKALGLRYSQMSADDWRLLDGIMKALKWRGWKHQGVTTWRPQLAGRQSPVQPQLI